MIITPSNKVDNHIEVISSNSKLLNDIWAFFSTKITDTISKLPEYVIEVQLWEHKTTKLDMSKWENIKTYFDYETILLESKKWILKILFMDNILLIKNGNKIDLTVQEYHSKSEVLIQHIVRSAVEKILIADWYWILHWWSFELNNEWYIILWEKWDWKTTILSQALYQKNASFISNDRVFFKQIEDWKIHLINREQHIRVWEKTALDIPILKQYIKKDTVQKDDNWKFYINDLPYLIWASPKNETLANHVVLPNFTKEKNFFDFTPVEMLNQSKIVDAKGFQLYNTLFAHWNANNYLHWDQQKHWFNPRIHKWDWVESIDDLISNL